MNLTLDQSRGNIYTRDGFPHRRTVTQDHVDADWRTGHVDPLEARVHHRILEDFITGSIYDCKNAKEMMRVLQDAFLAHRRAYELGILHRDISDNNVLLIRKADDSVAGVLADWDMAMKFERDSAENMILPTSQRQCHRKGTWYFMSARLLRDGTEAHTLRDDLESFFHLTLYLSIHWFPHTGAKTSLRRFVSGVFGQYDVDWDTGQSFGGDKKLLMFIDRDHIGNIEFTSNKPLTIWINAVFQTFRDSYTTKPPFYLEPQLHVHNHDVIASKFAEVLVMDGWPTDKIIGRP